MSSSILGIDPGSKGGIVTINPKTLKVLYAAKTPIDIKEKVGRIENFANTCLIGYAFIEMPLFFMPRQMKDGTKFSSSNAAGKLGKSQGEWYGILNCFLDDVFELSPATVKKFLKTQTKISGKASYKELSRAYTDSIPSFKAHTYGPRGGWQDGISDAICIAMAGYWQQQN